MHSNSTRRAQIRAQYGHLLFLPFHLARAALLTALRSGLTKELKRPEYLRSYVKTLRKKIEDDPAHPEYILRNPVGYRFRDPSDPDTAPPSFDKDDAESN
jgi:hypothetical protein